jgi:hypothetical protein
MHGLRVQREVRVIAAAELDDDAPHAAFLERLELVYGEAAPAVLIP